MSNKEFRFGVYQVPPSICESLNTQGKAIPLNYWGDAESDADWKFGRDTARELFESNAYREVARFDVTQPEDVFDMSNNPFYDDETREKYIDRLSDMHSVSVGDLILDRETNVFYIVAPFGFDQMEERMRRLV